MFVYAFSRRFYPKQLTNEDITSYIKKLTINYIEGTHWSDSVRGDRVEIECRHRRKYRKIKCRDRGGREVQGKC